jgi:hypothetical protein
MEGVKIQQTTFNVSFQFMKKLSFISIANKVFSFFLLCAIGISVVRYVFAATPNPGHDFSVIGGGAVQGDLIYGSAADTLSALAKDTNATRYLSNTGTNNNPAWSQIDLTNGVTGDLPFSNLAQGSALSILGVTGNATADVASIAAGTDHQVLRRSGTALSFGAINLAQSAAVTGILPTANGGTGMAFFTAAGPTVARTYTFPDANATVLTSNAAVTAAQGGTGLTTLTANNLLVGNGTGNVTFIAPGTSGNVLTSNGTTWSSAAPEVRTVYNQSTGNQGAGFASDTYVTGSDVAIPATGLQAGSRYHMIFEASKTAAGTAAPVLTVRFGTNGTTADTGRCTLTFSAQTAATDTGTFEVWVTFRTVGSGTSAVMQCVGQRRHGASVTGFGTLVSQTIKATSAGFDSTVANSIIGVSANGGTSAAWTVSLVQAELENLP